MTSHLDIMQTIKTCTEEELENTAKHILEILKKDKENGEKATKVICSIMGYLWETEQDQYRKRLLLEAAWMGVRMSAKLEYNHNVKDYDKYL